MHLRLALRLFALAALSLGLAELIELSPPAWKAFAAWLPPACITLLVAIAFGRSLYHGEPLITRIARAHHQGGLPEELVGYTRRLTAVWAWYMAAGALLMPALGLYTEFSHPGLLAPVMVISLLSGEYLFRRWRFRRYEHRSPLSILWFMLRHGMPRD